MRSIGVVRKIDELGRIVIPKELRRTLNIEHNTPVEIFTDNEGHIILKKYTPGCDNCERTEDVKTIGQIKLCKNCLEKAKELIE